MRGLVPEALLDCLVDEPVVDAVQLLSRLVCWRLQIRDAHYTILGFRHNLDRAFE